jgi:hypothetical protein
MASLPTRPSVVWRSDNAWPDTLDPRTICLTVDVEWAANEVLEDLCRLFDERSLTATFFCTHPNIEVSRHERGIHPNFRIAGDTIKQLRATKGDSALLDDIVVFRHVLGQTLSFAPEAKGARGHSLHYDSMLLPVYSELGLEYDSTYFIPLVAGLKPFWKEHNILELPIYFNDHFELKTGATGFDFHAIAIDRPGLKVINMHPNMVFLNAVSNDHYLATKSYYHDVERLLAARHSGFGVRTMVIDLLDAIVRARHPTATLGEINVGWRSQRAT